MTVRVESLSRAMIRRAIRLLDMEYKPAEIADELDVKKEQVIRLLTAGAPARKDLAGHYWINGAEFLAWLHKAAPKNEKAKNTFADDECWCMQCKEQVIFVETRRKSNIVYGTCPKGHKTARFISLKNKG